MANKKKDYKKFKSLAIETFKRSVPSWLRSKKMLEVKQRPGQDSQDHGNGRASAGQLSMTYKKDSRQGARTTIGGAATRHSIVPTMVNVHTRGQTAGSLKDSRCRAL